ncbi:hypothetical protein PoB_005886000 [Plakobranchus ocellatus]|uniref:Uncharacterized protein n=1 Tax=Plakobranchus ocellatus TaxID=259542 RepID=A0AAV4CKZ9_9GAST|nr:hypothetical protein PoB_005886000 [Plakobranchus ocellatus]
MSDFQARAAVTGLEPASEKLVQTSRQVSYPLWHQSPHHRLKASMADDGFELWTERPLNVSERLPWPLCHHERPALKRRLKPENT